MWRYLSRWISILFLTALAIGVQGCGGVADGPVRGSGELISKNRPVSGVSRVNYTAPGRLEIKLGEQEGLVVEAEENIVPLLKTEVAGETLNISVSEDTSIQPGKPIKFTLTVERLARVELSGSGDVIVPDLSGELITIILNGSGNVAAGDLKAGPGVTIESEGSGKITTGELKADFIKIFSGASGGIKIGRVDGNVVETVMEGSGNIVILGGRVLGQGLTVRGSGKYTAGSLRATEARVELSGSGNATVRAKDKILAKIAGDGNLLYFGQPEVEKQITGSGEVKSQK